MRDDCNKRLEDLYSKLQAGQIKNNTSAKVLELARAIERQDFPSAHKLQAELMTCEWETNKNWLQGVKRLVGR